MNEYLISYASSKSTNSILRVMASDIDDAYQKGIDSGLESSSIQWIQLNYGK